MTADRSDFGKLLQGFRTSINLTQQQFADLYGVNLSALQKWESGRFLPDTKNTIKLMNAVIDHGRQQLAVEMLSAVGIRLEVSAGLAGKPLTRRYWSAQCSYCHQDVLIFRYLSDPGTPPPDLTFHVKCVHCGKMFLLPARDLKVIERPPDEQK